MLLFKNSRVFSENIVQLDLNLLNPSWLLWAVCSFPSDKISLKSDHFILVEAVEWFNFLFANISSSMLQNFPHRFLKVIKCKWGMYIYYLYKLSSQVLGVCPAIRFKDVLPTSTSNSSLLMLAFKFSRVNLEIVLLVRSCIWRIKPIKVPTKKFFLPKVKNLSYLFGKKNGAASKKKQFSTQRKKIENCKVVKITKIIIFLKKKYLFAPA